MDRGNIKDFRVEKPVLYEREEGQKLSDLCIVFTDDGIIRMAQWGEDGYWHGEMDLQFQNVTHWYLRYPLPYNFMINYKEYGGEI